MASKAASGSMTRDEEISLIVVRTLKAMKEQEEERDRKKRTVKSDDKMFACCDGPARRV